MIANNPAELSATIAGQRIAAGVLTCEALARACLDRIAERENVIHAWTHCDPEEVIAAARAIDMRPAEGLLHGLPVGVKDIIDTKDMPTRLGSSIHAGRRPKQDAECVDRCRQAGALIVGKTVTTEFADWAAGPTRNPLDEERTPGGSSSGSAAAVADFMAPLAFGTQTGGSVNRPASFCGIVGFKPSFGLHPMHGIRSLSPSMDTLGFFARSVEDAALFSAGLQGRGRYNLSRPTAQAPAFGIWRMGRPAKVHPSTWDALDTAISLAERAGARVKELAFPSEFDAIVDLQVTLYKYEMSRAMLPEWHAHRDDLSSSMRRSIEEGLQISDSESQRCREGLQHLRERLPAVTADVDAIMTPAATSEALIGLSDTGDPLFSKPPTVLYGPAISLPCASGPSGLPIGVQLASTQGRDEHLLATAAWLEAAIGERDKRIKMRA